MSLCPLALALSLSRLKFHLCIINILNQLKPEKTTFARIFFPSTSGTSLIKYTPPHWGDTSHLLTPYSPSPVASSVFLSVAATVTGYFLGCSSLTWEERDLSTFLNPTSDLHTRPQVNRCTPRLHQEAPQYHSTTAPVTRPHDSSAN